MKLAIRKLPLFKNVKTETIKVIEKEVILLQCEKGDLLFDEKDKNSRIYIQLTGKSMIFNSTRQGRRKVLFILGEGALLNDNIFKEKRSSFSCEIIERSIICSIPAKVFQQCMEKDFALVKNVLTYQEHKMWRLGHQMKNTLGHIHMEKKLAAKLWKLQRDFGVAGPDGIEIDIDMSITFLAELMGAPRESTSRCFNQLQEMGYVEYYKKRIVVKDPDGLSAFYHAAPLKNEG